MTTKGFSLLSFLLLILSILFYHGASHAQESAHEQIVDECADKEWHCGVSDADKKKASELNELGTVSLHKGLLAEAAEHFRAALSHWPDQPRLHFNLMLALEGLQKYREAHEHAKAALRYGASGLPPDKYQRAIRSRNSLLSRFVQLQVVCDEPGAQVKLDGQAILRGPGRRDALVNPGEVNLVSKKDGYVVLHESRSLFPGTRYRAECHMIEEDKAIITTRRWPERQRWIVLGAGAALGTVAIGGLLQWRGSVNNQRFHDLFALQCPAGSGCLKSQYTSELESFERRSTWYRRVGYGAYVTGGAVLATGAVFLFLNRERQVKSPRYNELHRWEITKRVNVTGTVTPTSIAVTTAVTLF